MRGVSVVAPSSHAEPLANSTSESMISDVVLVGTRKALAMAVRNQDTSKRQTALALLIAHYVGPAVDTNA